MKNYSVVRSPKESNTFAVRANQAGYIFTVGMHQSEAEALCRKMNLIKRPKNWESICLDLDPKSAL